MQTSRLACLQNSFQDQFGCVQIRGHYEDPHREGSVRSGSSVQIRPPSEAVCTAAETGEARKIYPVGGGRGQENHGIPPVWTWSKGVFLSRQNPRKKDSHA